MRWSQKKLEQCGGAECVVNVVGGVGQGEMSGGMIEYMAAGDERKDLEPACSWQLGRGYRGGGGGAAREQGA